METVLLAAAVLAAAVPLLAIVLWSLVRLLPVSAYRTAGVEQPINDAVTDGVAYLRGSVSTRRFVRGEAERRRRIQQILNSTQPGQASLNTQQVVQQAHAELQMRGLLSTYKRTVATCNDLHNY